MSKMFYREIFYQHLLVFSTIYLPGAHLSEEPHRNFQVPGDRRRIYCDVIGHLWPMRHGVRSRTGWVTEGGGKKVISVSSSETKREKKSLVPKTVHRNENNLYILHSIINVRFWYSLCATRRESRKYPLSV